MPQLHAYPPLETITRLAIDAKEQNLKKLLQGSLSLEEFLFLSFYMKAHMGFGYLSFFILSS